MMFCDIKYSMLHCTCQIYDKKEHIALSFSKISNKEETVWQNNHP